MACTDIKFWDPTVPPGSTYQLSVIAPAGAATAFADYDDPTAAPIVHWSAADIVPGPKIQPLVPLGDHFIHITVGTLVPGSVVQVKADVTFPNGNKVSYCRTVVTTVSSEKITHQVQVAKP